MVATGVISGREQALAGQVAGMRREPEPWQVARFVDIVRVAHVLQDTVSLANGMGTVENRALPGGSRHKGHLKRVTALVGDKRIC